MNAKARVAVLEDDIDLCDSTVDFLDAKGYRVWGVSTGAEFFRRIPSEPVDVVILDVGLGKESGLDIASTLHASSNVAIIMVTALGQLEDRILGLTSGADTYLVKPVNFLELVANIEAVFRRLQHSKPQEGIGPWLLDMQKWLWLPPPHAGDQRSLQLTAKEYQLVHSLAEAKGGYVSKSELSRTLNGHEHHLGFNRIDVLLSRLRKKCEASLGLPAPIKAIPGLGFVLTVDCRLV